MSRYYLVRGTEIIHKGESAAVAVAAVYAAWNRQDPPSIVTYDGDTLRAMTLNDLEWDAVAEEAGKP